MVWQHARALEHETETLRAQLRPAFISGEPSARDADPPPAATAALRADIARLTQLVQQQHETLVRLAASADAGDPRALDESLEDARVLARRTAQPRPIGRQ
jgi:hypothetical protein